MKCRQLFTCALTFCLIVSFAGSESARPHGLMWNRTGLPLVFPLQVKSVAGRDYYMILIKADDGTRALAAYVRGGEFFRVLVPPGTFDIEFAAGSHWLDEKNLFGGTETITFSAPEPLTFAILDDSTKGGHIIDLRNLAPNGLPNIAVASTAICQGISDRRHARAETPQPSGLERDPVGQDILERRFLRGADVFETYDRERQQRDLDPPVLGLPNVPLAKPEKPQDGVLIGSPSPRQRAKRFYERPCF